MKTLKTNRIIGIGGDAPTNGAEVGIELQMPYRAEVTVEGACPMLFHAWNVESVESKSRAKKGSVEKKTDDVESFVYRDSNGIMCVPGDYLRGALVTAAKFQQDPRSTRKSAADLFKAGVTVITPLASLGVKTWDYLDKRRVTIQRNAITRSRPAMNTGWRASFVIQVMLPEYINQSLLQETLQAAGKFAGFGDYRPTYGRFNVVKFSVLVD